MSNVVLDKLTEPLPFKHAIGMIGIDEKHEYYCVHEPSPYIAFFTEVSKDRVKVFVKYDPNVKFKELIENSEFNIFMLLAIDLEFKIIPIENSMDSCLRRNDCGGGTDAKS